MKKTLFVIGMTIGALVLTALYPFMVLAESPNAKEVLHPPRVDVKPQIDGVLDEEIWQTQPLEKDFISYAPVAGKTLPFKTKIWMAYDNKNIYFAFLCLDPKPQKIKSTNTRKDEIRFDDWVGILLDSLGKELNAWALYVNPIGTQRDVIDSPSGSDPAAELEWESAGKVTDKGYQVEMAIPLRNLNFKSGSQVKMKILFWRHIARHNTRGCWPQYIPADGVYGSQTRAVYKDLKRPLKLDLIPHIVYGNDQQRVNPDKWEKDDPKEVGLDVKYGLTPTITADVTINPDFREVESDEWHLEVNRRYPIYFPEFRPYFRESMEIFDFFSMRTSYNAGLAWISPETFMPYPLDTRNIVDLQWAAKLTGSIGKTGIGFLAAGDRYPGRSWQGEENPNEGKSAFWGIARLKYSLGEDNYIGLFYSGREFADDSNRVFGADFLYRFFKSHNFAASILHSSSPGGSSSDHALKNSNINLEYSFRTRKVLFRAGFEHIGTDFRMDSAFLIRTGITHGVVAAQYDFTRFKKLKWLQRISPGIRLQYIHDLYTGQDDYTLALILDTRFAPAGNFGFFYLGSNENWMGQTFKTSQLHIYTWSQLTPWFRFAGSMTLGEKIFYQGEPPVKGKGIGPNFYVDIQLSKKLAQRFDYYYFTLSKGGKKIYSVNLYHSRTTFRFNEGNFLRAIVRYNSYQKKLQPEFLASFTLIPRTMLQVGYIGFYENREWQDNNWLYRQGDLLNVNRSFFVKLGYRWRL